MKTAWAAFALELGEGGQKIGLPDARLTPREGLVELNWGELWLQGSTRVGAVSRQSEAFGSKIGGKPIPEVRLSDVILA